MEKGRNPLSGRHCPARVGLTGLYNPSSDSLFLSFIQAMGRGFPPPPGFSAQPVLGKLSYRAPRRSRMDSFKGGLLRDTWRI